MDQPKQLPPRFTHLKLKPEYREKLRALAADNRRSLTNMLEWLIDAAAAVKPCIICEGTGRRSTFGPCPGCNGVGTVPSLSSAVRSRPDSEGG